MTTTAQREAMTTRIVAESLADLRWESMEREIPMRLEDVCADAIERGPFIAAWVTGRLALARMQAPARGAAHSGRLSNPEPATTP